MFGELWREIPAFIKVLWAITAMVSLAITGVMVWAIIALVLHFT